MMMKLKSLLAGILLGLCVGALAAFAAGTQLGLISNYTTTVVSISSTACTLHGSGGAGCSGSNDCGKTLLMTGTSPVISIPATLPAGCAVNIIQGGTTQVSITGSAVTPATLHTSNSFAGMTAGQNAMIGVLIQSNSGGSSAVALMVGNGA